MSVRSFLSNVRQTSCSSRPVTINQRRIIVYNYLSISAREAFNMDLLKLTVLGVTLLLSLDVVFGSEHPGVGIQDVTGHPIWVKCQSKDTQFDPRTMQNNDIWKWSFNPNFGGSTLYWCVFWWNKLGADFVVWDINTAPIYDHSINDWKVQEDGFYLYDPVKNVWNKEHSWAPASSLGDYSNAEMGLKVAVGGTVGV